MKLIEVDKVKRAIKVYWKAQVDKALTLTDGNEKRINIYLEHNHELLKAIDELPSAEQEALEKAVAVEAISDELLSRFDISATYAYEIAEKAMNRIEAMAKEIGKR